MEDRDYILFEDYLSNSLNTSAREDFEKRLKEDTTFLEAFELYKETSVFLEQKFSGKTERDAFKENLTKISNSLSTQKAVNQTKVRKFHPWKLAVAASVLVLVGVFYSQWFSTPVYSDYASYPQISLTVRGDGNQTKSQAENAFNSKNYQEAIPLFRTLLNAEPENREFQLYLAISLVEEDVFGEADLLFNKLIKEPSAYQNQARWFAALSTLKQKDYARTKSLLESIPPDAEEFQKAQKLLKKLK